jgi:hypothetical protein
MDAPKLWPMEGSAGKYISMANGPIADSKPKTMAARK